MIRMSDPPRATGDKKECIAQTSMNVMKATITVLILLLEHRIDGRTTSANTANRILTRLHGTTGAVFNPRNWVV